MVPEYQLMDAQSRIGEHVEVMARETKVKRLTLPAVITVRAAAVVGADATTCLLDLGDVPRGYTWTMRSLTIANSTGATATCAGTAYLYVGIPQGPAVPLESDDSGSWVDQAVTLPLSAFYDIHQVTAYAGEHFYIIVTGATALAGYTARAQVEQALTLAEALNSI